MPLHADTIARRLALVRGALPQRGIDALVVTHLANVRYLTGFVGTAGAVIVSSSRAQLMVDFRYVTNARAIADASGGLLTVDTFPGSYDEAIAATLLRERVHRTGVEAAHLSVSRFNAISAALANNAPLPLDTIGDTPVLVPTERIVETVRMVKDDEELATLREAARRLAGVARDVPAFVREGRTELEIAADIDAALRGAGFSHPAFDTIVASGPNSALPHARPTDRQLRTGDPAVLDFGGVYDGYCVDLTRTVQLGPTPAAMTPLYEAVARAHAAAIAAVRPGIRASVVDAAARDVLTAAGLGEAFGHGTGHGLGLEVHEEPRVSRPQPRQPDVLLEPGMVFTVEPGAYVPGVGGVRIEDDVVVSASACEVLTR